MSLQYLIYAIRMTNFVLVSYSLIDWICEPYKIFGSIFVPLVIITSALLHWAEAVAVRWQRDNANEI